MRVYNGWDDTLKGVRDDIAAQPDTDPTIHLLVARNDADRLDEALQQRIAAQTVLDQRGNPTTVEGDRGAGKRWRHAFPAKPIRTIKDIVEATARDSEVILAGGSVQSGAYLKDRLHAAAQAALIPASIPASILPTIRGGNVWSRLRKLVRPKR